MKFHMNRAAYELPSCKLPACELMSDDLPVCRISGSLNEHINRNFLPVSAACQCSHLGNIVVADFFDPYWRTI